MHNALFVSESSCTAGRERKRRWNNSGARTRWIGSHSCECWWRRSQLELAPEHIQQAFATPRPHFPLFYLALICDGPRNDTY